MSRNHKSTAAAGIFRPLFLRFHCGPRGLLRYAAKSARPFVPAQKQRDSLRESHHPYLTTKTNQSISLHSLFFIA